MRQVTFLNRRSFKKYARKTRREEFLSVKDAVVRWPELEALIEPHYPKAGKGRQPVGLGIILPDLLHGDEKKVWCDAGYQGQTEQILEVAPGAQDMASWRAKYEGGADENERRRNQTRARVRSKVEWLFRVLKRVFGLTTVRYRKRLAPLWAWCLRRPESALQSKQWRAGTALFIDDLRKNSNTLAAKLHRSKMPACAGVPLLNEKCVGLSLTGYLRAFPR